MTATLGGWLLILLLLAYLLHILWRQIAARSPVAIASFIAAYFVLAAFFRLSEPYTPLRPVWLPFVYSYSWLAIAAALWLPASACPTRRGLLLPAESPRIASPAGFTTVLYPWQPAHRACTGMAPNGRLRDAATTDGRAQLSAIPGVSVFPAAEQGWHIELALVAHRDNRRTDSQHVAGGLDCAHPAGLDLIALK
ncbi:hypothetical protein [Aquitalea pelogenes]|uniref:hypothetical protein n=1 Tax=Aquitalea pelogenes TaxID=1293573 RepID=UPI0035AF577D